MLIFVQSRLKSIFLIVLFIPLIGCEITIKTRDYHKEKSHKPLQKQTSKPTVSNSKKQVTPKTQSKQNMNVGTKLLRKLGFATNTTVSWVWPVKSTKENHISLKKTPEGMLFIGKPMTKVFASENGTVTYSGNSLKHYGNLIIIQHENDTISVYARNQKLSVKEGDKVFRGQEIAKMSPNGEMLFEIRQKGKAVDPLKYLPNKMQ